jgi:hypothetical protein
MKITYNFIRKVHAGQVSPSPEMWAVECALCNSEEVYYNPLKNLSALRKVKKIALQCIVDREAIKEFKPPYQSFMNQE